MLALFHQAAEQVGCVEKTPAGVVMRIRFLCLTFLLVSMATVIRDQKASPPMAVGEPATPIRRMFAPSTRVESAPTESVPTSTVPGSDIKAPAHGIFAVTGLSKPFDLQVLTNPYVDGIVVRTRWSDVEPQPGEYDWRYIDSQLALAEKYGKQVHLMIMPGFWSPQWVLDSVPTIIMRATYGHSRGYRGPLPVPWDQSYFDAWFKFVKAAGDRYDSHPRLALVSAAGPTSVSAEMSLPSYRKALAAWLRAGYTPDLYFAAWQRTFAAFDAAFPRTPFVFIQHSGLPIPDKWSARQMRRRVIEYGVSHFPQKFTLQSSGLAAWKENREASGGWELISELSDRINVGFMMSSAASAKAEQLGDAQDPVNALRQSIERGLRANAHYLEIYSQDVLNPAMQEALRYTHEQLWAEIGSVGEDPVLYLPLVARQLGTPTDPRGIYAVIRWHHAPRRRTWSTPCVDGVVIRTFWRDIEPEQGQYDWGFLDEQFSRAQRWGKKIHLIVAPGFWSPDWVLEQVPTAEFEVYSGPQKGFRGPLPLPWNDDYLDLWLRFVQVLADRYRGRPLAILSATGPTSQNGEMRLPARPEDVARWRELGYTTDKIEQAWFRTLSGFQSALQGIHFTIALFKVVPLPDDAASEQVRVDVAEHGARNYPSTFGLQSNGLDARKAEPRFNWELVEDYSGSILTGFMMSMPATLKPEEMGDPDPVQALRKSVDRGLAKGVDFLEIYEADVLNPDMQGIICDAHEQLIP